MNERQAERFDFCFAVFKGDLEAIDRMVAAGTDIHMLIDSSQNALHFAVEKNNLVMVRHLLAAGADANKRNLGGRSPLHIAADVPDKQDNDFWNTRLQIAQCLLDAGARINEGLSNPRELWDYTPLHLAVKTEEPLMVQFLIDAGANLETRAGDHGWTPLHRAAANGSKRMIDLLVAAGCDVDDKDSDGRSAVDLLREFGLSRLRDFMI